MSYDNPIPPYATHPNSHPLHQSPPPTQSISIHDIIQMRLALDTLTFKSKLTSESIGHLDTVIHIFTTSLNPGAPKP
jgi:hypothetical protein